MAVQVIGSLAGGRYRLEERLGTGGMGETFRALDTRLGRRVAVKLLHAHLAADSAFVRRLEREARIVASLSHPNIVSAFDYGTGESGSPGDIRPYLVMELVEGEDLRETLERRGAPTGGGPPAKQAAPVPAGALPLEDALAIARGVLSALAHAHGRGLVHRDVKPSNVLVAADGTVKLADFGIAVGLSEATVTQTGELLGSVHYIAPERLEGGAATPAADVYATGVLLYRVLAGRLPYEGELVAMVAAAARRGTPPPLDTFRTDVPAWLERLVRTALAADPHQRYRSAVEMLEELERGTDVERRASAPTAELRSGRDNRHSRRSDPDAVTVPLWPTGPAPLGTAGARTGRGSGVAARARLLPGRWRAIAAAGALAVVGVLALSTVLAASTRRGQAPATSAAATAVLPAGSPVPATPSTSPAASPAARVAPSATAASAAQPVSQVAPPGQPTRAVPGTATSVASTGSQSLAAMRAAAQQVGDLRVAVQAMGGRGKVADVVNELRELEKKLLEGDAKDAAKEVSELRRKVEEWRSKGELEPAVADRVLAGLARLAI